MITTREVDKKYFSALNGLVNNPDYNMSEHGSLDVILIKQKRSISDNLTIKSILQSVGFCVVEFAEFCHDYRIQYEVFLSNLLGEPLCGKHSGGQPFAKVQATENAKFYINSSLAQPMHTDEGHATVFPRYAALFCAKEAGEGGDSIIVPFKELHAALLRDFGCDVDLLFAQDAIAIENYQGMKIKPVLFTLNNGDVGISYSTVLQKMWCSERVFEMFDYVAKYVHNRDNQIRFKLKSGQMLIFDNCRVLHGRTSFSMNDPRLLYRYWFQQGSL